MSSQRITSCCFSASCDITRNPYQAVFGIFEQRGDLSRAGTAFEVQLDMKLPASVNLCLLLTGGLATFGCTGSKAPAPQARVYQDRPAAMLVFDPPVATLDASAQLPRDARERAAVVGYDDVTISSFYIRQEDRQSDDWGTAYNRSSYTTRAGTSYR